jgi:intein-encoded DNA endonuclease-like protein
MQSVSITNNVVSSNPAQAIKFVTDLRQVGVFLRGTQISSTKKTDRHYLTEILLKVALNTTTLTLTQG